ncbi:hypothetical protein CAPTEDRAFT_198605 [Capitella teleta]|uniref:VWFD domain-containing protein n=1 Tax=Capitella teleta TaxID=283909 RepID=R7UZR1_CAPTE|nr:hypothetical protein CAPTEDRAFT_198605 [Capitella teleta]|eukprot:ELU11732.1 hypothetical protein CAPTEDRAFT_198605 [Capitella teleta]
MTMKNPCKAPHLGYCLVCKNANTLAECFINGRYEALPGSDYVCYIKEISSSGRSLLSAGCKLASECTGVQESCEPDLVAGKMVCTSCGFLKNDDNFFTCNYDNNIDVCSCSGDPHCRQFWQSRHGPPLSLNASCTYILATDICFPVGQFSFGITGQFGWKFPGGKGRFIRNIDIVFYYQQRNMETLHLEQGIIKKNGTDAVTNFPETYKGASMAQIGALFRVTLPNGVVVYWDGAYAIRIEVNANQKVCGLCGQHGRTKDFKGFDLSVSVEQLRSCPSLNVTTTAPKRALSVEEFMNSWYAGGNGQFGCDVPCP